MSTMQVEIIQNFILIIFISLLKNYTYKCLMLPVRTKFFLKVNTEYIFGNRRQSLRLSAVVVPACRSSYNPLIKVLGNEQIFNEANKRQLF